MKRLMTTLLKSLVIEILNTEGKMKLNVFAHQSIKNQALKPPFAISSQKIIILPEVYDLQDSDREESICQSIQINFPTIFPDLVTAHRDQPKRIMEKLLNSIGTVRERGIFNMSQNFDRKNYESLEEKNLFLLFSILLDWIDSFVSQEIFGIFFDLTLIILYKLDSLGHTDMVLGYIKYYIKKQDGSHSQYREEILTEIRKAYSEQMNNELNRLLEEFLIEFDPIQLIEDYLIAHELLQPNIKH